MSAARDELHPALLLMNAAPTLRDELLADRALFHAVSRSALPLDLKNRVRFRIRAIDAAIAELGAQP